jgi:hypothetical protein
LLQERTKEGKPRLKADTMMQGKLITAQAIAAILLLVAFTPVQAVPLVTPGPLAQPAATVYLPLIRQDIPPQRGSNSALSQCKDCFWPQASGLSWLPCPKTWLELFRSFTEQNRVRLQPDLNEAEVEIAPGIQAVAAPGRPTGLSCPPPSLSRGAGGVTLMVATRCFVLGVSASKQPLSRWFRH